MSYFEKYEIEKDYLYLNDFTKPRYVHVNDCSPIRIKDDINNLIEVDNNIIKEEIERFYGLSDKKETVLAQAILQIKSSREKEEIYNCAGIYIDDKNRDINFVDYRNKFYDLISLESFTENKDKKKVLQNIHKDSSVVVKLINKKFTRNTSVYNNIIKVGKDLVKNLLNSVVEDKSMLSKKVLVEKENNININTALVGGAVRDFVLGNEGKIKDLDIVVSFQDYTIEDIDKIINQENNLNNKNKEVYKSIEGFLFQEYIKKQKQSEVEIDGIKVQRFTNEFEETEFAQTLKMFGAYLITKEALEQHYDVEDFTNAMVGILTQEVTDGNAGGTGYKLLTDKTFGVLKVKNKKLNYPIDILITDKDLNSFLQEFDLDICKASFILTQKLEQKNLPVKCEHLVSRFYAKPGFLYDVLSKKITYDVKMEGKDATNKTLFEHFPRVLKKYEDYELNIWQSIKNHEPAEAHLRNVQIAYNYENIKDTLKEDEAPKPSVNNANLRKRKL